MKKKIVSLLTLSAIFLSAAPAFAASGSGGGGGGNVPSPVTNTCTNEIRDVVLRSGGNKGGHTLSPNSMHVFYDFYYVPCVAVGRINVQVLDNVTKQESGTQVKWGSLDADGNALFTFSKSWMTPDGLLTTSTWPWIGSAYSYGLLYHLAHNTNDAKFSYTYDVVITAYDYYTGVVTSSVTKSITTDKKL